MEMTDVRVPYIQEGEYGFTNNEDRLRGAQQFRDDAERDGWVKTPTYGTESVERASSLSKDGFKMLILTRDNSADGRGKKYEATVNIWAPDRLSVNTPQFYDFNELVRRTRVCSKCNAKDVDTERYSFAGRCCSACLPAMRTATEQPGWCD
jgi:hypothetical protein